MARVLEIIHAQFEYPTMWLPMASRLQVLLYYSFSVPEVFQFDVHVDTSSWIQHWYVWTVAFLRTAE